MLYVDTCAFAKRYLPDEEQYEECAALMEHYACWATSRLTSLEAARAIKRAAVSWGEAIREVANLDDDLGSSILIEVDRATLAIARQVTSETGIKSSDAIHIASALRIREAEPQFLTYDERQARAAEHVGLTLAR